MSITTGTITTKTSLKCTACQNYNTVCAAQTTTTLTAATLTNQNYDISSGGTPSYIFPTFTIAATCTDTSFWYQLTLSDGTAAPSFLTMTSSTRTISWASATSANVGTYNLKVNGTLQNGQSISATFTLVLTNNCNVATVTASTLTAQSYIISATALSYTFTAFTPSTTGCGITYTLDLSSGAAYDSSFITFTDTSLNIGVYTTLTAKAGTYTLRVTGTVTGFTNSASATFVLTVGDACTSTTITSYAVAAQTYTLGASAVTTTAFTAWTESVGTCGTFTYTAALSSGTALDGTLITFSSAARTFTISSSTQSHATNSPYTIRVTGTLTNGVTAFRDFTLTVTDSCTTATRNPSSLTD